MEGFPGGCLNGNVDFSFRQVAFQLVAYHEQETHALKCEVKRLRNLLSEAHSNPEAHGNLRTTASTRDSVGSGGLPLPLLPGMSSDNLSTSSFKAMSDNPPIGKMKENIKLNSIVNGKVMSMTSDGSEEEKKKAPTRKASPRPPNRPSGKSVEEWMAENAGALAKAKPAEDKKAKRQKGKQETLGNMVLNEDEVNHMRALHNPAIRKTWCEWLQSFIISRSEERKSEEEEEDVRGCLRMVQRRVKSMISTPLFDVFIGVIIVAHSVAIGIETSESVTHDRQPEIIMTLEHFFLGAYIVELVLRIFADGPIKALKSHWVKFDALLVIIGIVNQAIQMLPNDGAIDGLDDVMLVRILRISRLAKTARLMIQFRTLWMLVQGLMHSILTLLWTLLIVWVLCYIFAILGMELFKDTRDTVTASATYSQEYIQIGQDNFGNMLDAMMTMFQFLTLDSVSSLYRPLISERPLLALYFVSFLLLVPIALMNLVTAIMVESSLKQASEDQEAQRAWDKQKRKVLLPKLARLFKDLDADGSGELDLEELRGANETIKEQLMAICNWGEVEDIFNQLDYDSSGAVGIDEFCEGLLKAGTDKPVELYCIMRQCCDILNNSRQALAYLEGGSPDSPRPSMRQSTNSTDIST